jgi:hypothetical protein
LVWFDFVRLIFLLVGLVCWGIFLGSVGCAAGDGENEKEEKLAGVGCAAVDRRGENVKKKEKWREREVKFFKKYVYKLIVKKKII